MGGDDNIVVLPTRAQDQPATDDPILAAVRNPKDQAVGSQTRLFGELHRLLLIIARLWLRSLFPICNMTWGFGGLVSGVYRVGAATRRFSGGAGALWRA